MLEQIQESINSIFEGLTFDDPSHTYNYKGKQVPKSVSALIKNFEEKTDFKAIAKAIAKRDRKSATDVEAGWKKTADDAIKKGKETHSFAEGDMKDPKIDEQEALKKFWEELPAHYIVIRRELPMVHLSYFYSGTSDVILLNMQTGKFVIVDYKTNKDLYKNFKGKTLMYPFNNMLDSPISKYELQLCFYQILLEQTGRQVEERWVIWTKGKEYQKIICRDFTAQLKIWLQENPTLLSL